MLPLTAKRRNGTVSKIKPKTTARQEQGRLPAVEVQGSPSIGEFTILPTIKAHASPTIREFTSNATAEVIISVGGPAPRKPTNPITPAEPANNSPHRARPVEEQIQAVLRESVPEWRERFPTPEEISRAEFRRKARHALKMDPRTESFDWDQKRHSFWRAVGWE
jgi:hypothetical protein